VALTAERNTRIDRSKRQVPIIWENCNIDPYDRPIGTENLKVEPEEEAEADKTGPYIVRSEVEKFLKVMRDRMLLNTMTDYNCWQNVVSEC
jgi:hypothetical protein